MGVICLSLSGSEVDLQDTRYKIFSNSTRFDSNYTNGDTFFPLKMWPSEMRLPFFKETYIGDQQTFKLFLFCTGNVCSPDLICPWIPIMGTS